MSNQSYYASSQPYPSPQGHPQQIQQSYQGGHPAHAPPHAPPHGYAPHPQPQPQVVVVEHHDRGRSNAAETGLTACFYGLLCCWCAEGACEICFWL